MHFWYSHVNAEKGKNNSTKWNIENMFIFHRKIVKTVFYALLFKEVRRVSYDIMYDSCSMKCLCDSTQCMNVLCCIVCMCTSMLCVCICTYTELYCIVLRQQIIQIFHDFLTAHNYCSIKQHAIIYSYWSMCKLMISQTI